ncbi:hypothetical protein SKAU_G00036870 [Synaphobranchus kaupii]|uniref:Uncharacterized protein n=1 Tax=Synaphobranchus kaupii TaxID=118154 RepID=A0A9Q1GEY1_SYNKA|nr:hypothetical protein SKAU_G00036870 [Synaphobranchus kaupii]
MNLGAGSQERECHIDFHTFNLRESRSDFNDRREGSKGTRSCWSQQKRRSLGLIQQCKADGTVPLSPYNVVFNFLPTTLSH